MLFRPLLGCWVLLGLNRLGSHVGLILREQGKDQTDELTSGQDERALVLMFWHLGILAPVVGLVFQVVLADVVCPFDEVIAQVYITRFR